MYPTILQPLANPAKPAKKPRKSYFAAADILGPILHPSFTHSNDEEMVLDSRGSEIISPTGKVLAKAQTEGDELVTATIDVDEIASVKNKWNLLADRRPEIYHRLVQ